MKRPAGALRLVAVAYSVVLVASCSPAVVAGTATPIRPSFPAGSDLRTMVFDTPEPVSETLDIGAPIGEVTTDHLCRAIPLAALSELLSVDLTPEVLTVLDPDRVGCTINNNTVGSNTRVYVDAVLKTSQSEKDIYSHSSGNPPGTTQSVDDQLIAGFPGFTILTESPDLNQTAGINVLMVGVGLNDEATVELTVVSDSDFERAAVVGIVEQLVRNLQP
jgi:hypothetical protein